MNKIYAAGLFSVPWFFCFRGGNMKKKITLSGSMLVFFGALFWSLNAPLVKFLQVDALLTCGLRSLIAGVFLLPFLRHLRKLHDRKPDCPD